MFENSKTTLLTGDNAYMCPTCNKKVDASKGQKMNKELTYPGHLNRVRELTEICGVNYRIGLNWVQPEEIDTVKICRTYLIT